MLLKQWLEDAVLKMRSGNLVPRILTGIVIALLFFTAPFLSLQFFQFLLWVSAALAAREWIRMIIPRKHRQEDIFAAYVLMAILGAVSLLINPLIGLVLMLLCVFLILNIGRYALSERFWMSFGLFYITCAVFALSFLNSSFEIVFLLLGVAAADIGAFFVGKTFGGPRLWPEVSPKKTWSGFFGGLGLAALAGWIFAIVNNSQMPVTVVLMIIVIAAIGQAGDLLESRIKRYHKIKDTGNLLPGHGGILDRVDGYLLAAPLFVVAWQFFKIYPW